MNAIKDWLPLFAEERNAPKKKMARGGGATTPVISVPSNPTPTPNAALIDAQAPVEGNESYMQPQTVAPVNSLLGGSSDSDCGDSGTEASVLEEPMDCVANAQSQPIVQEPLPSGYDSGCADCSVSEAESAIQDKGQTKVEIMQVDAVPATLSELQSNCHSCSTPSVVEKSVTDEDLHLLVDMFYMPFQHGSRSCDLLTELVWLKLNCCYVTEARSQNKAEKDDQTAARSSEWLERARVYKLQLLNVNASFDKFLQMPNKAILADLFNYIWDMKTILSLVDTFVDWLGMLACPCVKVWVV